MVGVEEPMMIHQLRQTEEPLVPQSAQAVPERSGVPGFIVWSLVALLTGVVGYAVGFDRGSGGPAARRK